MNIKNITDAAQKAIKNAMDAASKNTVKARDFINDYGSREYDIKNSDIGYKLGNNGTNDLTVGGQNIGTGYINPNNNSTYAGQDQLRAGIDAYAQNMGIKKTSDLAKPPAAYVNPNQDKINAVLDKILSPQKFGYNYETDPSYQAYKQSYNKEGERAFQNQLGNLSANTGGMQNSWAVSAASQAQQGYNEKLSNVIPELQQAAYSRYQNEQSQNMNAFNALNAQEATNYNRYRDTVADQNTANNFEYALRNDQYNKSRNEKLDNWSMDVNNNPQLLGQVLDNQIRQAQAQAAADPNSYANQKSAIELGMLKVEYQKALELLPYAPAEAQAKLEEIQARINQTNTETSVIPQKLAIDQYQAQTGRMSAGTSAGNLTLGQQKFEYEKDPNNIDNLYKAAQINEINGKTSSQTLGPLYQSMMDSGNPEKWLQQNSYLLKDDEVKALYGYLPKDNILEKALAEAMSRR